MVDFSQFVLMLDERISRELETQERVFAAYSKSEVGNKISSHAQISALNTLHKLIHDAWKDAGGTLKDRKK